MAVDARHRAREIRQLLPPPSVEEAEHLALSSGAVGRVCISWRQRGSTAERLITCYEHGSSQPRLVGRMRGWGFLALRADGRALAWTERVEHPTYPTDNLVVADLGAAGTEHVQRVTSSTRDCPGECFQGCSPDALSWAGREALLLTASCESDDGNPLRLLDLAKLAEGWAAASDSIAPPDSEQPYLKYDGGGTATATSGYAVARGGAFDDEGPPERAVRVDLRTGALLEVVATAQEDRYVASITGAASLVVYTTVASFGEAGGTDPRFYARLAGERRGARLSGLPSRTQAVVAFG